MRKCTIRNLFLGCLFMLTIYFSCMQVEASTLGNGPGMTSQVQHEDTSYVSYEENCYESVENSWQRYNSCDGKGMHEKYEGENVCEERRQLAFGEIEAANDIERYGTFTNYGNVAKEVMESVFDIVRDEVTKEIVKYSPLFEQKIEKREVADAPTTKEPFENPGSDADQPFDQVWFFLHAENRKIVSNQKTKKRISRRPEGDATKGNNNVCMKTRVKKHTEVVSFGVQKQVAWRTRKETLY